MSRSRGGKGSIRSALMRISPPLGCSSPAIKRSTVDLPQPEGPSRMQNSPSVTSNETFFKTSVAPKRLDRFFIASEAIHPPGIDSTFDCAGAQAANNTALKNQGQNDQWDGRDSGRCSDLAPWHGVLAGEQRNAYWKSLNGWIRHNDERKKELVPCIDEYQQRGGEYSRRRQRQDHLV